MPMSSRLKAFFAYLFLALGGIVVLLISRKDQYAVFHARQSIALTIVAIAGPLILSAACYGIALIPLVGPILASASFALVIALLLTLVVVWIMGLVRALRAESQPLPIAGDFAARWF